jgi:predicted deacylase
MTILLFIVSMLHAQAQEFDNLSPISDNPPQAQYSDVRSYLHQLADSSPSTVSVFQLGVTDSGEMVEGVKVGNGPMPTMVVATHHGNEYGSTEVARAFAAAVAAAPIEGQTVYVIPVLNVVGYNAKNRGEPSADGVTRDPNRDYPGPCGTEGPHHLISTRLLADFVASKGIVASATLHTFSPAVVYPWGISSHDLSTSYDDLFKMLVTAATQDSHYQTGNSTEVIYPADGTYEDYAFWQHGIWSILFELGDTHSPSNDQVADMVRTNVPGLRRMLEQAPHERAANHAFTGKCDTVQGIMPLALDRHDE